MVEETQPPKRKRGRKAKTDNVVIETTAAVKQPKKRGRKPKGGKIVTTSAPPEAVAVPEPNIILHLRCSISDLTSSEFFSSMAYDPTVNPVETFQFEQAKGCDLGFQVIQNNDVVRQPTDSCDSTVCTDSDQDDNQKVIWKKLRDLAINLHTNNISDKRSACFWCSCEFDNPPIYIPQYELNHSYHCYGCFCSPECATAHLFKENIDNATRFERYHMLNHIYCKIYDYTKNVKPAPDPHYTLEKFYGNLTIQEYRQQLKNERLLLIVDKPLTRILPELHEDNDDFVLNAKAIPSAKYKLRRRAKQSKGDILAENFNLK